MGIQGGKAVEEGQNVTVVVEKGSLDGDKKSDARRELVGQVGETRD